jgi:hypothetical protein
MDMWRNVFQSDQLEDSEQFWYTRGVWKVRGLSAVRRCYAEGAVTYTKL